MNGKDIIKKYEGLELSAYSCPAGIPTIGYGATFYEDGSKVKIGDKITKEQAEALLDAHYKLFESQVLHVLNVGINKNQLGALVSFAFNLGIGSLKNSTLLKKINQEDFVGAANEFDKWVYANKVKLNGLVKRRAEEKALFMTEVTVPKEESKPAPIFVQKEPESNGLVKLLKGLFGK